MRSVINKRRVEYAFYLTRCANTVCMTTLDEIQMIVERSLSGEFDKDIFKEDNEFTTLLDSKYNNAATKDKLQNEKL